VTINNRIYGFAGFAGWMITKRMFFDGCSSIKWVIEQITDEIPDSIPERIVQINKGRNLEESWNNLEIIVSLEPEYYDKMKDIDVTNTYIPDIANFGMKKGIENFLSRMH
jgi:hypothetical protein